MTRHERHEFAALSPHRRHLVLTNVYWRQRPIVGVVRSLRAIAERHGEVV